jgi:nucleoid-associated protein YgaU
MPKDAKLGLVIGVGLVMVVAVVFFRKDLAATPPATDNVAGSGGAPAAGAKGVPPVKEAPAVTEERPVRAKPSSQKGDAAVAEPTLRRHTVREGDTLFSLAVRYYGDAERCTDLLRANREVLDKPDELKPGTVLVIPNLGKEKEAVPE